MLHTLDNNNNNDTTTTTTTTTTATATTNTNNNNNNNLNPPTQLYILSITRNYKCSLRLAVVSYVKQTT